jgi:hypothetical protein
VDPENITAGYPNLVLNNVMGIMIHQTYKSAIGTSHKNLWEVSGVSAWTRLWTAAAFVTTLYLQLIFHMYAFTKEEFNNTINFLLLKHFPVIISHQA